MKKLYMHAVIDEQTNHSTKPASWQVAGYPAQAGIQCYFQNAVVFVLLRRCVQLTGFPPARE
jgi:hypothetical protein